MTPLLALTYALLVGACVAAGLVSRGARGARPLAAFLGVTLTASLARTAIKAWIIIPARLAFVATGGDPVRTPIPGIAVACVVDSALFLAWPAGLAALAIVMFSTRRAWPVLVVWSAVGVALAVAYPEPRLDALRRVYLAAELGALVVAAGCLVLWTWSKTSSGVEHAALAVLLAVEAGSLVVGPWAQSGFFSTWPLAQIMYCCAYATIIVILGGRLCFKPFSSPP